MTQEPFSITIDPDFEKLLPALSPQEFEQLKYNLSRDGFLSPLTCWMDRANKKLILLDGHNRLRIWREKEPVFALRFNMKSPPIRTVELASREEALLWIKEHQLGRRNQSESQRAMMWEEVLEQRSKVASAEAAAKAREAKSKADSAKTAETAKRDQREEVAKEAKLPVSALRNARKIRMEDPELAKEVLAGTKTIREAIAQLKTRTFLPDLKVGDEVYVDGIDGPVIRRVTDFLIHRVESRGQRQDTPFIELGEYGRYRRDDGKGYEEAQGRAITRIATPEDRNKLAALEKYRDERDHTYLAIFEQAAEFQRLVVEKGWPCVVKPIKGGLDLRFSFLKADQVQILIDALPALVGVVPK